MDENRSDEDNSTSGSHQSDGSEASESDESDISSPLGSMVMTDSSNPQAASDSDDLASVIDLEEESLIPLGSDEAEGNGMVPVLNISSDSDTLGSNSDIQDRLVVKIKKGVDFPHRLLRIIIMY